MNPLKSHRPMVVPQTLGVRLEIAKAIRALFSHGDVQKFDPSQPRVPAGNPDGGQWTNENEEPQNSVDVQSILGRAKQLAVSRASMSRCVDLCYPLLERIQPPGSDRNEFDFRKCLNQCLGLNR